MSLKAAKIELEAAKKSLEEMKGANDIETFEIAWRNYLNCLEKLWVKVEGGCQNVRNKFQPWQGTFTSIRKKDSLLKYLKQARDADNHSIQEVAEIKPGHTSMNFVNPRGGFIKHMEISGGKLVHYEGDPMQVTDHPPTLEAVRVKNSGKWYNPPKTHLNKNLQSCHPVEIASLGIVFYTRYLNETEKKFF